jgi:phage anti-repressor protein
MKKGCLTKDDVERFEGELGRLVVLKKALELAMVNPALKDDQKRAYSRALLQCERTLREFRGALIAMRIGLTRWASGPRVRQAA